MISWGSCRLRMCGCYLSPPLCKRRLTPPTPLSPLTGSGTCPASSGTIGLHGQLHRSSEVLVRAATARPGSRRTRRSTTRSARASWRCTNWAQRECWRPGSRRPPAASRWSCCSTSSRATCSAARARAFAADPLARDAARTILDNGWDKAMTPDERMFAYLPFEHSRIAGGSGALSRADEGNRRVPGNRRPAEMGAKRTASSSAASAGFPTATRPSGAPARPRRPNSSSSPAQASESVIAPLLAVETSRMYFASSPLV